MDSNNLYESFQRLNDFDQANWCQSNWPNAQDHFCIQLLEQFDDLEQPAQLSLSRKLLGSSLEKPLELFAACCAKFGDCRELPVEALRWVLFRLRGRKFNFSSKIPLKALSIPYYYKFGKLILVDHYSKLGKQLQRNYNYRFLLHFW